MKSKIKYIVIPILLILLAYTVCISNLPNNIIVFQGEKINFKLIAGINLFQKESYQTMQASNPIGEKLENVSDSSRKN